MYCALSPLTSGQAFGVPTRSVSPVCHGPFFASSSSNTVRERGQENVTPMQFSGCPSIYEERRSKDTNKDAPKDTERLK